MLESGNEVRTASQFFELADKQRSAQVVLEYLESDDISFKFALKCVKHIQDFVYLDVDLQKLRSYAHDSKNEEQYVQILRQLIGQKVRKELVQFFSKLDVSAALYDLLPQYNCEHVLYLDISKQKTIKNGDLDLFVNLRGLNMSECDQDTIATGFLDRLLDLDILNMSKCNQKTIGAGFLSKPLNLRLLVMFSCDQETIKNGFVDGLVNLTELDMTGCDQETIKNGFLDNVINLTELNMSHCNQETIKNGFVDGLVNLTKLGMSGCCQETIGNGFVDKLTNLTELNVSLWR